MPKIRSMEGERTLGRMVYERMDVLGLDLEGAAELTGISERHLRRIIEDEGGAPQGVTRERLQRLGLSEREIALGNNRTKLQQLQAKAAALQSQLAPRREALTA